MLDFVSLDPVNVGRCLSFFVQVLKTPYVTQVVLTHQLIGVLGRLLNFREDLNLVEVDVGRSRRFQQLQGALIFEHASLLRRKTGTRLLHGQSLELASLILDRFELARQCLAQLVEAIVDDHLEVLEFAMQDVVRSLLVSFLLYHLDVTIDDFLPFFRVELCQLIRAIPQ